MKPFKFIFIVIILLGTSFTISCDSEESGDSLVRPAKMPESIESANGVWYITEIRDYDEDSGWIEDKFPLTASEGSYAATSQLYLQFNTSSVVSREYYQFSKSNVPELPEGIWYCSDNDEDYKIVGTTLTKYDGGDNPVNIYTVTLEDWDLTLDTGEGEWIKATFVDTSMIASALENCNIVESE